MSRSQDKRLAIQKGLDCGHGTMKYAVKDIGMVCAGCMRTHIELCHKILEQCLVDFKGIENEVIKAKFMEWTTVANTMRWIEETITPEGSR